ncbi:hypothetical protein QBZ16_005228 [Prototheca wickerhamii]|uniref:Endonuclease/exonuclease/phosphatase domain-containing protein n=1 Tax=Prototheca wickerhamii TaxID=3111 RepID=A0AAD9II42_PROWI|nr:hypothetical protein QBZ16_005228 [Prototheca wickerhamii]
MAPHEELAARFSVEELQELDAEGRAVVTDHGAFVLFNLYGPAITTSESEAAAARFDFKLRFYAALQARWDELARRGRAVIVVGDLNICAAPLDTCEPKSFALESRADRLWLRQLLGFPTPQRAAAYTVWSTATAARINNHGQRIDYTLVAGLPVAPNGPSASLGPLAVAAADISPDRDGSDHCPVWVDLAGGPVPVAASAPPGALRHVTLRNWLSAPAAAEAAAAEAQRRAALSEAKSAWSRIHTKMGAPRCRHGEQAALKRTNKSGDNKVTRGAVPL